MKGTVVIVLLIAIGALSLWHFLPRNYDETLNGVSYRLGDEEAFKKVQLHFEGKLQNRLNGTKTFKGTVKIEGEGIPKLPEDRTELVLDYHGDRFSPISSGFRIQKDTGSVSASIYNYGWLYTNDDFTRFAVIIFDQEAALPWSSFNGLIVTAPAGDRAEALQISRRLIENNPMGNGVIGSD